jgi:uncharacterized protein YcfJ
MERMSMNRPWICGLLLVGSLLSQPLLAQNHTQRGAALGGVAGALAGAGIGEHNGDTAAGALIGGALGLVTGAAIGNSMDQEAARARALEQQRLWQLSRGTSLSDVVTMTHNGVGDDVIINQIRQNGVQRRLEVADVISLHQRGVSEAVITEMQRARLASHLPAPPPRYQAAPVIIEEHHYVPARVHYWPHPVRYGHHRHVYLPRRTGFHWSIGVRR